MNPDLILTTISHADDGAVTAQLDVLDAWKAGLDPLPRVAVVYGGLSPEDQLYLAQSPAEQTSLHALVASLTALDLPYKVVDPCDKTAIRDLASADVVLSNLHGVYGEDGRLQGLLDYLRVPYTGSGVAASALAADKLTCKRIMDDLGIPTPEWTTRPYFDGPAMVKPRMGGSSVGMALARTDQELIQAYAKAAAIDPAGVVVEEYMAGMPVTVAALELPGGVVVFPPLATHVHGGADFYDADTKLDPGQRELATWSRADLAEDVTARLIADTLTLWEGLGCHGMARVDFIVSGDEGWALEVNTNPGMSAHSNFAESAKLSGIDHEHVVLAMLHEALSRSLPDVPLPAPDFTA